jgi:hypothetical protein
MRTDKEIKAEIEKLKAIKPKVRRYTVFGDNHWAAIDAQIEVLANRIDQDGADDICDEQHKT